MYNERVEHIVLWIIAAIVISSMLGFVIFTSLNEEAEKVDYSTDTLFLEAPRTGTNSFEDSNEIVEIPTVLPDTTTTLRRRIDAENEISTRIAADPLSSPKEFIKRQTEINNSTDLTDAQKKTLIDNLEDKKISWRGTISDVDISRSGYSIDIISDIDPDIGVTCFTDDDKVLEYNKGDFLSFSGNPDYFLRGIMVFSCTSTLITESNKMETE